MCVCLYVHNQTCMSICVMAVGDARWIGGLTKVVIYSAPKGCSPCHSNTGSEGYKVAYYLVNLQIT